MLNIVMTEEYIKWNARLLDYCLEECRERNTDFVLLVRQMLDDQDEEDAEGQFVEAVRETYSNLLQQTDNPFGYLAREKDSENRPLCGALLGLSVRAAEEMGGLNYYVHLATLLQQHPDKSSVRGFDHDSFENCWETLVRWVCRCGSNCLTPMPNLQKYIRWPKSHALLRRMDIEKLHNSFFLSYGYNPLRNYTSMHIENNMRDWAKHNLTKQGLDAFKVRRPAVIRQVLHTLSQWDGTVTKTNTVSSSTRLSNVKVMRSDAWLEWRDKDGLPAFKLVARRLSGFPSRISNNLVTWQFADNEWYESIIATSWHFSHLEQGFEVGAKHRVRFAGAPAFVFSPSEYGNSYDSQQEGLPIGTTRGVLCRFSDKERVATYLKSICGEVVASHPIPQSSHWVFFFPIKAVRQVLPPPYLDVLRTTNRLEVEFQGGLRTGKKHTWLHGSPPNFITVKGLAVPNKITITRNLLSEDEPIKDVYLYDGKADITHVLTSVGTYILNIGDEIRRITIDDFRICSVPQTKELEEIPYEFYESASEKSTTSNLPAGSWAAIGAKIGEISLAGEVPSFEIQWLIGRDEKGTLGKIALQSLPKCSSREYVTSNSRAIRCWVDTILTGETARLGTLAHESKQTILMQSWQSYVNEARRLRRLHQYSAEKYREGLDD